MLCCFLNDVRVHVDTKPAADEDVASFGRCMGGLLQGEISQGITLRKA